MPLFTFHLRRGGVVSLDDTGIHAVDLHHAYLEAIKSIPDMAREMLIDGEDPMMCAFVIGDDQGRPLMDVPFREVIGRDRPG